MNCEKCKSELSLYLDDIQNSRTRAEIDAHLAECSHCREYLQELGETLSLLHDLEDAPLPYGFKERMEARLAVEAEAIAVEKAQPISIFTRIRNNPFIPRVAIAACFLIWCIATADLVNGGKTEQAQPEPVAYSVNNQLAGANAEVSDVQLDKVQSARSSLANANEQNEAKKLDDAGNKATISANSGSDIQSIEKATVADKGEQGSKPPVYYILLSVAILLFFVYLLLRKRFAPHK